MRIVHSIDSYMLNITNGVASTAVENQVELSSIKGMNNRFVYLCIGDTSCIVSAESLKKALENVTNQ